MKKVIVNCLRSGVYVVDEKGLSVELPLGNSSVCEKQAEHLVKRSFAKYPENSTPDVSDEEKAKKKASAEKAAATRAANKAKKEAEKLAKEEAEKE